MNCCRKSNKNTQPAWHARYEAPCSAEVLAALSGASERDTATGRQKLCPAASRPDARLAAFQTSWSDKTTLVSACWNSLPSVGRRKAGRPGLVLDRHSCRIRQPFILIDFDDTVFRLFLQDGLRQQTTVEGGRVKDDCPIRTAGKRPDLAILRTWKLTRSIADSRPLRSSVEIGESRTGP